MAIYVIYESGSYYNFATENISDTLKGGSINYHRYIKLN